MFGKPKRYEYVKCPHCDGTGKCKCGYPAIQGIEWEGGRNVKESYGVECLCLGVCDSCKGKGYHKREVFDER